MSTATLRQAPVLRKLRNLTVIGKRTVSPHFIRLTFGGPELGDFTYLGFDQWFRFFMPTSPASIASIPCENGLIDWATLKQVPETDRPVVRNYTVRAFRPGASVTAREMDVDVVIHSAGEQPAGKGEAWVKQCRVGDTAAFFDEGCAFSLQPDAKRLVVVCEESGLPAAIGILASLPRDVAGAALLEVPELADRQPLDGPLGMDVRWLARDDAAARPGQLALAEFVRQPNLADGCQVFAVGEIALTAGVNEHMKSLGPTSRGRVFTQAYWRHGHRKSW